jgi:nicotinamidase-related amidase
MVLFGCVKSDQCVLHTRSDANFSGYGWVMATDCCATVSPDFCAEAAVWSVKKYLGFCATPVPPSPQMQPRMQPW